MNLADYDCIASALGISRSTAVRKAKEESWPYIKTAIKGGYKKQFPIKKLPDPVRIALAGSGMTAVVNSPSTAAMAGAETGERILKAERETLEKEKIRKEANFRAFAEVLPEKQATAYARRDVLRARDHYLRASSTGNVKQGTKEFCRLYNDGEIRVGDHIRNQIKKVSWSTLGRWQRAFNKSGLLGLVPNYRNPNKGRTKLTPEQVDFILGMIYKQPHIKFTTLQMALEARFKSLPSEHSIRRFVKRWKKENKSLLLFITNPDKWRDKHQFAVGDASEQIARLNQVWEFDSTPADIMLADGRYCLIGVIDVYSRRLKLLVSKTSRSSAVAALIRRTLLDWGVPETAKTDNGADYVSDHIVSTFEALEIEQLLCPPFTPEAKPHIERAFRTFAHSFQELMPGYIGHSVADRKDIEARRSFAARIMQQEQTVEILMTAEELQKYCDRWCNAIYHRNKHRGLNNRSPIEVARAWQETVRAISDERALDILLAESPSNKGRRTVTKNGVSVNNITYISDGLPETGMEVKVKLDPTDLGTIYLFDLSGTFLCVAQDPMRTGVDRAETSVKLKNRQKQLVQAARKEMKKIARKQALEEIHEEILQSREAQIDNIIDLPSREKEYTTSALTEAGRAAGEFDKISKESEFDDFVIPTDTTDPIVPAKEEKIILLRSDSDQYDLIRTQTKQQKRKLTRSEYDFLTRYYETATGRSYRSIEGDLRETIGLENKAQAEG